MVALSFGRFLETIPKKARKKPQTKHHPPTPSQATAGFEPARGGRSCGSLHAGAGGAGLAGVSGLCDTGKKGRECVGVEVSREQSFRTYVYPAGLRIGGNT